MTFVDLIAAMSPVIFLLPAFAWRNLVICWAFPKVLPFPPLPLPALHWSILERESDIFTQPTLVMVCYLDFKPGLKTGSAPLQKSFPVKGSLGGPPHDAKWSVHLWFKYAASKSLHFNISPYVPVQRGPVNSVSTGQCHWHLHQLKVDVMVLKWQFFGAFYMHLSSVVSFII